MQRAKIVATVGPACDGVETLAEMVRSGVDVARINLSHGSIEDHRRLVGVARSAAERAGRPHTAVLFDTRGSELRVGDLGAGGVELESGARVVLLGGDEGAAAAAPPPDGAYLVPVDYPRLAGAVSAGDCVLLDDGNIVLEVLEARGAAVTCRVTAGGHLRSDKKVTLPQPPADLPALTPEDREDLRLAVELEVDSVAASFVRSADDVIAVRRALEEAGGRQHVVAKIENASGVKNVDAILEAADGLMVARGDLGVEVPSEDVPLLQKRLIAACNDLGKPVITATQMLESMVSRPRPTRAEASDVANAIFDGTDAVMLSAETATGKYPVEVVRVMARIARRAEEALDYEDVLARAARTHHDTVTDAISYACCTTAHALGAAAIITATQSGHTARMVSRHRPRPPVVAVTPIPRVARVLNLVWGVTPLVIRFTNTTDAMMEEALAATLQAKMVQPGALVVITAGVPAGVSGTTNMLEVVTVGQVMLTGTGIGRGGRTAPARVARMPQGLRDFTDGDVLVTAALDEGWMPLAGRAGALVVEEGGLTSQAAIVALNFGIPAVVGAEAATDRIPDGETVTVDAGTGRVYRGRATVR